MATKTLQNKRTISQAFGLALADLTPEKRFIGNGAINQTWLGGFLGGVTTKNGAVVNETTALTLSAFFNGIDLIGNDIAKLGKGIFKKDGDKRTRLTDHPLDYLLSKEPNFLQSGFMFHKMIPIIAILKGNFYAGIDRNSNTGDPIGFDVWNPDEVEVRQFNKKLFYKFKGKTYLAADVIHIPGFSLNGITGISVIKMAAKSLGVALSSQEFSAEYYESKGVGSGIITSPRDLNKTAKGKVSKAVSDVMTTVSAWHIPVLDEGMTFTPLKITAQEANFLATNKHAVEECARWLNLPLHKLKSLDHATNNNIEHQSIEHVGDSILPWVLRTEQEFDRKIFSFSEKLTHFYKYNIQSLLRADTKTQTDHLSKMVLTGIYTVNEARKLQDMDPVDDGDTRLTPVNVFTEDQLKKNLKKED